MIPTSPPPPRTDDNLKRDLKNFAEAGNSDEKKAKYYHNVIRPPILNVPIHQTAVPYLHIALGITKKHDQLLEDQCDEIDKQTAENKASSDKQV